MQEREVVLTKREVEARLVPSGTEIMIPSDTFVTITQSLGGTFTVAVNGNLARIEGHNADALEIADRLDVHAGSARQLADS